MGLLLTSALVMAPGASATQETPGTQEILASSSDSKDAAKALDSTGIYFEENLGQFHQDVLFKVHGTGTTTFLTATGAVFDLVEPTQAPEEDPMDPEAYLQVDEEATVEHVALHLTFEGVHPAVALGKDLLPGISNHFKGNDPTKWITHVPHYERVTYTNIYTGIDLVWYAGESGLKYDFIVQPGADPGQIQFHFNGASNVHTDTDGRLVVQTSLGDLVKDQPYTYQVSQEGQEEVGNAYVLQDGGITFDVGEYDPTQVLVIDPLVYSTSIGGSGSDWGRDIAVDASGNAYVTGYTGSTDYPTTMGAYQTSTGGLYDVFVTKLSPSGSALVYSTYIGGSSWDHGVGIVLDASGNAYVTGDTSSTNFPTTSGAYQTSKGGGVDVFVMKLSATGTSLAYSTFIGDSDDEHGRDIAMDASGNAYITGNTLSTNYPTTAGAYQTSQGGGTWDVFVTKLSASGSALVYSTYLVGSGFGNGDDFGTGIAVDASGNAYVTGSTGSPNYPTTAGAYQTSQVGISDVFVTKLSATGASLAYSTFIGGGSGVNYGYGIALDAGGNAYITGHTDSTNYPTTIGAYQTSTGGSKDVFVTKLSATGASLAYSTYVGGSSDDVGMDIAVDGSGNAFITGYTSSTNFPTTAGAYQTSYGGGSRDVFVTKLAANGGSLAYGTYIGGSSDDKGIGIVVDSSGNAYVAGETFVAKLDVLSPSSPQDLNAACADPHGTILAWQAASVPPGQPSISEYRVYAGTSPNPSTKIATVGGSTTSYHHQPAWTASPYYYRVSAYNGLESAKSNEVNLVLCDTGDPSILNGNKVLPWTSGSTVSLGGTSTSDVGWQDAYSGLKNDAKYRVGAGAWTNFPTQPSSGTTSTWRPSSFSLGISSLGDGLTLVATDIGDRAGNRLEATGWTIRVDRAEPVVTAGTLDQLQDWTNGNPMPTYSSVCWTDATSGIAGIQFWVGRASNPFANGPFTVSSFTSGTTSQVCPGIQPPASSLVQGTDNHVTIRVTDQAGKQDEVAGYRVAYDSVGEEVTDLVPRVSCTGATLPVAAWQTDNAPCFTWTAASGSSPVVGYSTSSSLSSTTNPNTVVDTTGTSKTVGTLSDGKWFFKARANDEASNWGTIAQTQLWVDTTPPVVTSGTAPVVRPWTGGPSNSPTIGGLCFTDVTSGMVSMHYWISTTPGASPPTEAGWQSVALTSCPSLAVDTSLLVEGENYVTFRVRDAAANEWKGHAYTLRYDTVEDAVTGLVGRVSCTGLILSSATWHQDNTPAFAWNTPSSTSPISGYSRTLSTSLSATPDKVIDTTDTCFQPSSLSDGKWFFKVRARDASLNWGPVETTETWVDVTDPVITSLSSTTHGDPSRFHNRTSASVTWSASDATSGIKQYHYEVVDGSCPSTLTSPTMTAANAATEAVPGPFKKYRFCIQAEDHAGNLGSIESLNLFVDTAKPVFTRVDPGDGDSTEDPLKRIEIDYHDEDGGLDTDEDTIVDVSLVKFFVDGVDIQAAWGEFCAPGGLFYPTGCRLEVNAGGITFEPLQPWQEGWHDIFVSVTDTVAGGGNTATLSSSFLLQCTGSTDADCDHVNDQVEEELCTRAATKDVVIPATEELGHSCSGDDYRPVVMTVLVPTGVQEGPDADGDGLPEHVRIQRMSVSVDVERSTLLSTSSAPDEVVALDDGATGDDSDPNVPVQSVVTVPVPVPTGFHFGSDNDSDGVPRSVTVEMGTVTFDRRNPLNPVSLQEEPGVTVFVDDPQGVGDDQDADSPAPSDAVTVSVPTNAWHNGDGDDDYVPGSVTVQYLDITVDRTDPGLVRTSTRTETHVLDEDDNDRDNNVPFSLVDGDNDDVPDTLEFPICLIEDQGDPVDGTCTADLQDYTPPGDELAPNPWDMV